MEKLGSLEIEEKRMLKTFRSDVKTLQTKQKEQLFKTLCQRRNKNAGNQVRLQTEVGQ